MATGRSDYEDRKEQRIGRYNNRAAKAGVESERLLEKARKLGEMIPMGQPILVGHHSEKRHRADLKRIETGARKSIEADEKAEYYQNKAETAANNESISGDNPEASSLYEEKLKKLEALQERMKAVNSYWRKNKTMKGYPHLSDKAASDIDEQMKTAYSWIQKSGPYADYRLKNNNAEIRRIKEKLETIKKLDNMENETVVFPGGKLFINTDINRVQFVFDDKPSVDVRGVLKQNGFKWAPTEGAWQRQRTDNAVRAARRLIGDLERLTGNGSNP